MGSKQDAAGVFDSRNMVANAIAALAVSEAYGLTESFVWWSPARKGVDCLQNQDSTEPRFCVWKGLVLRSADYSNLGVLDKQSIPKLVDRLSTFEDIQALSGRLVLRSWAKEPRDEMLARELCKLDPQAIDPEERFVAALAMRGAWKVESWEWRTWADKLKGALLAARRERLLCEHHFSYDTLALEVYYRYACTLAEAR